MRAKVLLAMLGLALAWGVRTYVRWQAEVLPFNVHAGGLLAPLLAPRVPGTPGHAAARAHILQTLERAGWAVEEHHFDATTPDGMVPMTNVLARRLGDDAQPPPLTLAAHYDSKRAPAGFIGATDSAFPCALLLYLAQLGPSKRPFDLIFFDGEEAFNEWTETDSLYGSRALAAKLHREKRLPETLVLLDLLGCDNPPIASWFENTRALHKELHRIDPRLVGGRPVHEYGGYMMDDHIPFLELGVPVLHLIPTRFPDVWHTIDDNAECLDADVMQAWADLFTKWLQIE